MTDFNESKNQALLRLAKTIALSAGELLSTRPHAFDIQMKSSAVDFATQMDHASEALIVNALLEARPHDGVIGEEGSSRESSSDITWVIDPLDGTVNYFYGLPGWNVSIAAKDSSTGEVLVGVVYSPSIKCLWEASKGDGAYLNNQRISCNNPIQLDRALIGTGFSYNLSKREEQAILASKLIPKVRDLRRCGAAATDLCYVAMGALDGYYEYGLQEWDHAAGGLIAREAGAVVSGRLNGPPGHEMVIAAGPVLHQILIDEIC